jgi:diaminopimelate epimerase
MRFIKYQGLGNDFILFEGGLEGAPAIPPEVVARLCRRGHSVGADGVMLARRDAAGRLRMELTNSDGSTPEMCGNGLRCFVKHAVDELGVRDSPVEIATEGGVKHCHWRPAGGGTTLVRVDMGAPSFDRARIPMLGEGPAERVQVPCEGRTFEATGVNTGNPHMVIFGEMESAATWGPKLTVHPWWPLGTNVEFVELAGPARLRVTVYERGCGLTQACGTGATAAAAAAVRLGRMPFDTPITVAMPGGELAITLEAGFRTAWMEGPAVEVYRGELALELLGQSASPPGYP